MSEQGLELACPHADRCGGCAWLGTPYATQLAQKHEQLERALRGYPELAELRVDGTRAAEPITGYRVRAKLVAEGKKVGLYGKGGHDVVDIPECLVLSAPVKLAVAATRRALPLPFPLLGIDAREVDRGSLVTLIVPPDATRSLVLAAAEALMRAEPTILGVALSRRNARAPQLLGAAPEPLCGVASAPHRFAPAAPFHEAVPGGFVQSHAAQTDRLHAEVVAALGRALHGLDGRSVLELYAGAGALALRLSKSGAQVTACDSFAPNLATVTRAASAQGLEVEVRTGTAEQVLEPSAGFAAGGFDAIVVDPPRRGLSPAARCGIARLAPRALIYVACEPRTLARDLAHLCRSGFRLASATPWDMIPLSDAVEALTVLVQGPLPAPRILHEERDWLAVDKPAFLPTIARAKSEDSLLARVRKLPGAGDAVPLGGLGLGTSGIACFAKTPSAAAELGRVLTEIEQEHLLLARGIVRKKGRIERALGQGRARRRSATSYRREAVIGTHSLVRASLAGGDEHRLGRLFASVGHPLLGDEQSGDAATNRHFIERHGLDRPFLHCQRLTLRLGERELTIESDLAPELRMVLASLEATRGRQEGQPEAGGSTGRQEPASLSK